MKKFFIIICITLLSSILPTFANTEEYLNLNWWKSFNDDCLINNLITVSQNNYDLKNTDLSYTEICQNYGISKQSLIGINSGKRFFQDYLDYPIRRVAFSGNGANKDEVQKIKDDLISKKYKKIELAKKYNCSCNTINRINKGISYFDKNLVYPLCHFNNELEESELREIEHLLIDTNISINKIAEQFSISTATIKRINKGETKKYFNSLLKYPLRKK